jgi:hypothetical protein
MMVEGDCFFLRFIDKHMWCVISDPSVNAEQVVVVMFCTWKEYREQVCILKAGDHPFIDRDTCVEFNMGRIMRNADLDRHLGLGNMDLREPLSTQVLKRIRDAASLGDLPIGCINVLRDQGFLE